MDEKITCRCDACGKTLAVPSHASGKKIRCPSCQAIVAVPASAPIDRPETPEKKPSPKPAQKPDPPKPTSSKPASKPNSKPKAQRAPDPWETDTAADPYADAYSYANAPLPPRESKKNSERSSAQSVPTRAYEPYSEPALEDRMVRTTADDDELSGSDILLCILCSNIACIVGLIRICTGRSSSGLKMILICLLTNVIATIIGVMAGVASSMGNAGR